MKLAEALILRADQQTRLEQLKQRLLNNIKVQEGDTPAEDPAALLQEIERVAATLTRLIQQINHTNSVTRLDDEMTLTDALAVRDMLSKRQHIYRQVAEAATITQHRFSRSEIRFTTVVDVADIQQQADDLARAYRELDARVQQANWTVELID